MRAKIKLLIRIYNSRIVQKPTYVSERKIAMGDRPPPISPQQLQLPLPNFGNNSQQELRDQFNGMRRGGIQPRPQGWPKGVTPTADKMHTVFYSPNKRCELENVHLDGQDSKRSRKGHNTHDAYNGASRNMQDPLFLSQLHISDMHTTV